jgi:ankyrin repeat protein
MAYSDHESSSSLAMRLLSVAAEYEVGVKRDRQQLESRVLQLTERNISLERQTKADGETIDSLSKAVSKLKTEATKAAIDVDDRLKNADVELMQSRFMLHERTAQLADVLRMLLKLDLTTSKPIEGDMENIDPSQLRSKDEDNSTLVARSCPTLSNVPSLPNYVEYLGQNLLSLGSSSRTALFKAVHNGDEEATDGILRPSSTINRDSDSELSLEVVELLSEALLVAARMGHAGVAKKLLSSGAAVEYRSQDGMFRTALHVAALTGQESVVKSFLSKELINVDSKDAYRRTALHLAAASGQASTVKLLLLNGADPTCTDIHGHTGLHLANGIDLQALPPTTAAHFSTGELEANSASPETIAVLEDPNVMFWNASLRANKYYTSKRFEKAIEAYTLALELAPVCNSVCESHFSAQTAATFCECPPVQPPSARDMATLHYNRARARYRLGQHCAAVEDCTSALRNDASYRNALAQRAECYMSVFEFDKATRDFQGLLDSDPSDRQWSRRLQDARNMRDMSHYGILGVRRDADGAAIKRQYRALCLRWHPDKHSDSAEDVLRANTAFRVRYVPQGLSSWSSLDITVCRELTTLTRPWRILINA